MDPKNFGKWVAAPFNSVIGSLTMFFVAIGFVLWLGGFIAESITGSQILPELIAPTRKTEIQQIAEDEIWCGMMNALVDLKAASDKSKEVEDKVLKTILNHKREYRKSLCNILYDMNTLIPPGTVRRGVPRRQAWYLSTEFALEGTRKRALSERMRQLEKEGYGHVLVPEWRATHYVRPNRQRTKGNQTAQEIEGLKKALDPVPKAKITMPDGRVFDHPEGGFRFFQPKQ